MSGSFLDSRYVIVWAAKSPESPMFELVVFDTAALEKALSNLKRYDRVVMSVSREVYRNWYYGVGEWVKTEMSVSSLTEKSV